MMTLPVEPPGGPALSSAEEPFWIRPGETPHAGTHRDLNGPVSAELLDAHATWLRLQYDNLLPVIDRAVERVGRGALKSSAEWLTSLPDRRPTPSYRRADRVGSVT